MRLLFIRDGHIQTGNSAGVVSFEFAAGAVADVPDDVAVLFLGQGVAESVKVERATRAPKVEKAVKA